MRQPPDKAERRPLDKTGALDIAHGGGDSFKVSTALVPIQARRGDTCWRCGTPFAWTTDEVLRRCTELARAAA